MLAFTTLYQKHFQFVTLLFKTFYKLVENQPINKGYE
ncbi:hypothetical protein SAMN04487990_11268 [Bizionia paragorgiae]|uniref:Uncharacterized protein n=1 Tax=Bizionia paragorgiae TaxID=283786 RepID=A0A1H4AY73_BIZPA|nr:hypothetical protein SAMN04487990_11268 [Bizionia paragorgiae]